MAGFLTLPMILGAVGTGVSALGTIAAGRQQQAAAEFQAKQMNQQANEERAATQREQMAARRQEAMVQSRLQATSASSGLGALDPTVLELGGDIAAEGAMQRGMLGYTGETRARNLETGASAAIMQGNAAKQAATIGAFGTILGGATSLYDKYGPKTRLTTPAVTNNYYYG